MRYGGGSEEDEAKEDEGDGEEYGHNEEIAMLELYSQSARGEALLVHALVDGEEVEVLIYKVSPSKVMADGAQSNFK